MDPYLARKTRLVPRRVKAGSSVSTFSPLDLGTRMCAWEGRMRIGAQQSGDGTVWAPSSIGFQLEHPPNLDHKPGSTSHPPLLCRFPERVQFSVELSYPNHSITLQSHNFTHSFIKVSNPPSIQIYKSIFILLTMTFPVWFEGCQLHKYPIFTQMVCT